MKQESDSGSLANFSKKNEAKLVGVKPAKDSQDGTRQITKSDSTLRPADISS